MNTNMHIPECLAPMLPKMVKIENTTNSICELIFQNYGLKHFQLSSVNHKCIIPR